MKSGLSFMFLSTNTGVTMINSGIIICILFYVITCRASQILGIYPLDSNSEVHAGGTLKVQLYIPISIRIIGSNLTWDNKLFFTTSEKRCTFVRSGSLFPITAISPTKSSAVVKVKFDSISSIERFWYICLIINSTLEKYVVVHQGTEEWLRTEPVEKKFDFPDWVKILIGATLLTLSGLFSGLNLGMLSLDLTELQIIEKVGSAKEKKYAARIIPLRRRGNLLLCTLVLGNVLVNSTFTILFDSVTNGVVAVMGSTLGIVVFGEIVPQAICSRHGLAVGANTYWITVLFVFVTFPISFPISLALDCILGKEIGQAYSKEKLQELIRMNADKRVLLDNEANIISGALQLTTKSVEDVMTKVEDVYMLEINTVLDFETITEIMHQGYTRIPVYDAETGNIINLLNTKELALIDPDDKTLLSTVCKFYDHRPLFVDHDVKLDAMLQAFLQCKQIIQAAYVTMFV